MKSNADSSNYHKKVKKLVNYLAATSDKNTECRNQIHHGFMTASKYIYIYIYIYGFMTASIYIYIYIYYNDEIINIIPEEEPVNPILEMHSDDLIKSNDSKLTLCVRLV